MYDPIPMHVDDAEPRRRRWWPLGLLLFASLTLAGAVSLPLVSGRTDPPRYTRDAAARAVESARREGADRWAPRELREAEAAFRASLTEYRRQEVRFLLLRDFSGARASLEAAESKARLAAERAASHREDARAGAESSIERAGSACAVSEEFAEAMHLGPVERMTLQRSRLALSEARILFGQGEYDGARDLAEQALRRAESVNGRATEAARRYTDREVVRNWRRMVDDTVSWSRETGRAAIVVLKEQHRLTLYVGGKAVRSYTADMGYRSVNDKLQSGDAATPEGRYRIVSKKGKGESVYHKALLLDYPNEEDRERFRQMRREGRLSRRARLGGLIEIHGEGGRGKDWTRGCVALSNDEIDDLFDRVGPGTPVTIVGGDGNGGKFTRLVRRANRPEETSDVVK